MSKKNAAKAVASKAAAKSVPAKSGPAKRPASQPASKKSGAASVRKPQAAEHKLIAADKKAPIKVAPKASAPVKAANLKLPRAAAMESSAKQTTAKAPPTRTMATAKPTASKKSEGGSHRMAARAKASDVVLPAGYQPSEDEPFMSELHRAYFRKRLIEWKDDILRQTRETLAILHEDSTQHADLADRATSETDRATELRTRDRLRKLVSKIDAAIGRIEDGTYGYCEDTGEPIGLKRLDARPIATLSVEAQERHERREKVYREE